PPARRVQRRHPLLPRRAGDPGRDTLAARGAARPLPHPGASRPVDPEPEPDAGQSREDPRLEPGARPVRTVSTKPTRADRSDLRAERLPHQRLRASKLPHKVASAIVEEIVGRDLEA